MDTISVPSASVPNEEWADADFDIPDGHALAAASDIESDKDSDADEDWDMEMNLGPTGGAKLALPRPTPPLAAPKSATIVINPPHNPDVDEEDDDEGVSTIKVSAIPHAVPRTPTRQAEDDLESAFALPSDLAHLSLRTLPPQPLSKTALEWGDKDHTASSTSSSEAYSSLGLGVTASPSSGTSASQTETETEDDEDDGMLDGIVVPPGLFDSGKGGKELTRILEFKKKLPRVDEHVQIASPSGDEDFEDGLVIEDELALSPSRLLQHQRQASFPNRSKSMPARNVVATRPPSRLRHETLAPSIPPPRPASASARNRQMTKSPTLVVRPRPLSRAQTTSTALPLQPPPQLLPPPTIQTASSLRGQKSHNVLSQTSAPPRRGLIRKASLSTLLDATAEMSSTVTTVKSKNAPTPIPKSVSTHTLAATRYDGSTASSRAKAQSANFPTSSRLHAPEQRVPPARPNTPSSNPAALRLTMPTASSRLKARPAIHAVFAAVTPMSRTNATSPPNPCSSPVPRSQSSIDSATAKPGARLLRRPKRAQQYGDGTELDGIDDLPTDRDKERKYRVTPKQQAARIAPTRGSPKDKGTVARRSGRLENSASDAAKLVGVPQPPRQKSRNDLLARLPESPTRRRRAQTNAARRKPTLIRNLGGPAAPKVVGDMRWNPQALRWEGNEQAMREFDAAVGTSTRPALITQLTGSSIGSPVSSLAGGARIVGNMIFDSERMCWISRLPPEEDEPDVFADLADDEEDGDGWEEKGGTIRASNAGAILATPSTLARASDRLSTPSPAASRHSRAFSDASEFDEDQMIVVDPHLVTATRTAEARHRAEMKGWTSGFGQGSHRSRAPLDSELDRSFLFEIRAVATRKYDA